MESLGGHGLWSRTTAREAAPQQHQPEAATTVTLGYLGLGQPLYQLFTDFIPHSICCMVHQRTGEVAGVDNHGQVPLGPAVTEITHEQVPEGLEVRKLVVFGLFHGG